MSSHVGGGGWGGYAQLVSCKRERGFRYENMLQKSTAGDKSWRFLVRVGRGKVEEKGGGGG